MNKPKSKLSAIELINHKSVKGNTKLINLFIKYVKAHRLPYNEKMNLFKTELDKVGVSDWSLTVAKARVLIPSLPQKIRNLDGVVDYFMDHYRTTIEDDCLGDMLSFVKHVNFPILITGDDDIDNEKIRHCYNLAYLGYVSDKLTDVKCIIKDEIFNS